MNNMDFTKLYANKAMRKNLLDNPRKALEKVNIELMENIEFKVVVNTKETFYFIIQDKNLYDTNVSNINAGKPEYISSIGSIGTVGTVGTATSTFGSASSVTTVSTSSTVNP